MSNLLWPHSFKNPALKFTLLILLVAPQWTNANTSQQHILNAGINLGWAVARLELRGDRDPVNMAEVLAAVERAAMHIDTARTLFRQPYRDDRRIEGIDQRIIIKANEFLQRADSLSLAEKISHVRQIWWSYRLSFETTFMDRPRSDDDRTGYHYYPNCDFSILNVGYHLGRADIASREVGNDARSYQGSANGSMRAAVQSGLNVALDGYPYGPQTNVRKACCYFGTKEAWATMPNFQSSSQSPLYENYRPNLQAQVLNTVMPPGACGGEPRDREYEECHLNYPGSVYGGIDEHGQLICVCPEGFTWNSDRTACEKLLPPDQLCARDYPNSISNGRAADGSVNCTCPQEYTWNHNRTACEKLLPPDQLCARDYPGSVAEGRAHDGSVNCRCPQGYSWNSDNTACVQSQTANTAECNRIIGNWRWFTERDVEFTANNRWVTHDGFTGSWRCNADGSITVIPDQGDWIDTVRVSPDGSTLSGSNQHGVHVSAQKHGTETQQECPPGYNPYGCL